MRKPLDIVLVDDDKHDHFFFSRALNEIAIPTHLTIIENGEKLMEYLSENIQKQLPDVVFLDLNMPRKNGAECLTEIKQNRNLKDLPIVIYSTSFHKDVLNIFYKYGAFYCIQKTASHEELKKNLLTILQSVVSNNKAQPPKEEFLLGNHS